MDIEYRDQEAQGANDQNQNQDTSQTDGNNKPQQNAGSGQSKDWEQNQNSGQQQSAQSDQQGENVAQNQNIANSWKSDDQAEPNSPAQSENPEQNQNIANSWTSEEQPTDQGSSQQGGEQGSMQSGDRQGQDQNFQMGNSGSSPTDQQPSASQNNDWQQAHEQGSTADTGQQGFGQYETNSRPSREYSASEDDELEQQMPTDYRTDEFIEENELERTDQDYRDADNRSGEDQDEEDALRNGI